MKTGTRQEATGIRKIICLILSALLLALCAPTQAQQAKKVPLIGYFSGNSVFADSPRVKALKQELLALGRVEGQNIAIEYRYADGKSERFPDLVTELVRLKVDVLVVPATSEALAAKNATWTIPIIFTGVSDLVASGLVDSLARPGGNITGLTGIAAVLSGKRLELLKETVPRLSRVAVLWDPRDPGSTQQWKESELPARELALQLNSMEVSSVDKFEDSFKKVVKARNAALAVTSSPLINSYQKRIADLATKNRLPAIYPGADFVDNGGLMSYAPDQAERYRRVASMVDKILKGARPADLPVEQPMKIELVTNLKAAKQIGLTVPPNVLVRADKVIK